MGFFEKDNNALTGNSMMIDDLIITWDDQEEAQLDDADIPCDTSADRQKQTGKENS